MSSAKLILIGLQVCGTACSIFQGDGSREIAAGKKLYEAQCKNCHPLFDSLTGPPMYGAFERAPGKDWVYRFIKNPFEMMGNDSLADCLQNKYNVMMPAFSLSEKEINAIYSYVYAEAKKKKDVWQNKQYFIPCL